jgi:hypothetical protein
VPTLDINELARRVQDLDTAAVLPDPGAERRRRSAEPDLEFRGLLHPAAAAASPARNWSGPGTAGRPSATGAARSAGGPATPITRSGRAGVSGPVAASGDRPDSAEDSAPSNDESHRHLRREMWRSRRPKFGLSEVMAH